jgi:HlyD family secretion protein
VDVSLEGSLPPGARPDLSVAGTLELDRLDDVLFVSRPALGQPGATLNLFEVDPDDTGATRTEVHLGRSSVKSIEIVGGLHEGDRVILSDMSQWSQAQRVKLR